jgi:hypothetical protein
LETIAMPKPSILWIGGTASVLLVFAASFSMIRHVKANMREPAIAPVKQTYAFGRCYPSTSAAPLAVRQSAKGKVTYWETESKSANPSKHEVEILHFRTEGEKCKWLNRNRVAFRLDYLPPSVAVALASQYFAPMLGACKAQNPERKDVDVFCAGDMEMGLSGTEQTPQIMFPEEIKALEAMNIKTKFIKNVRVISRSSDIRATGF